MLDIDLTLHHFQNQIPLRLEIGSYIVKSASTPQEVLGALKLRHEVFYEEFLNQVHPTGLDIDRYDHFFDHLIVVETKTNQIVATYRLYCAGASGDFYSKSEFDLTDLDNQTGPYLEIGRACVRKNFRKSTVLACLWRGISEYLRASGAQTLLGCASIKSEDAAQVAKLTHHFERKGVITNDHRCAPWARFEMPGLQHELQKARTGIWTADDEQFCEDLIPPLFRSYLKAGVKVSPTPAWDQDFKCVDYLIFLDIKNMNGIYEKRYL